MNITKGTGTAICWFLAAALGASALASPQTITWSAQNPGAGLGSAAGSALQEGAVVRLGYFLITPEEIDTVFDDVGFLESQFIEVGRERVGNFGGVVHGERVETAPASFNVPGAFAQTITVDSDSIPLDARFFIWATDAATIPAITEQALFSSSDWRLSSLPATALQWGIENVSPRPRSKDDFYFGVQGPEHSEQVGGLLNKLLAVMPPELGPGDQEDPDGNGVVALLEEAFAVTDSAKAHVSLPHMTAADTLIFHRKPNGSGDDWALYLADGIEYRIEASIDLETWQLASKFVELVDRKATITESGAEQVSLRFDRATGTRHFFRIRVLRVSSNPEQPVTLVE